MEIITLWYEMPPILRASILLIGVLGMAPPLHTLETPHAGHKSNRNATQQPCPSKFAKNPLVDRDPSYAQTPDGRFCKSLGSFPSYCKTNTVFLGYMGPTSSWSFCRRVLALIGRKLPEANCPPDPFHPDGTAFKLHWRSLAPDEVPDVTNLPPLDYALFLFNTVKFYFGFLSFMIDESNYLRNLHEFYRDPAAKAAAARPWFCQYLLVLAFGKAFLTQKNHSGAPPGHQYASRAMALLPGLSGIDEDPLTCIQALSLGAVYLQSIDMRRAAFQYVSEYLPSDDILALRMTMKLIGFGHRLVMRCVAVSLKEFIGMYPRRYAEPSFLGNVGQYSGLFTRWIENFPL